MRVLVTSSRMPFALDAIRKLGSLLRYGDAYEGPTSANGETALVVVMPRLGTVSPWASKATAVESMPPDRWLAVRP